MTPGMQMRLWFQRATPKERRATVGLALGALALILLSLVARPSGPATTVAAGTTGTSTRAGGAPGAAPAGGTAASPATTSGAATSPGGAALVPGRTAGGSGVAGVASTSADDLAGGTAGGGDASASGSVPLTASDRGVSETEVKIGVLPANVGGLSGAGFALDVRDDAPQYAQALADYVNNHGGVNGRKVTVAVRKTDPTSQSDQAAACQAMVSDAQVFGVIDVGSLADTPAFDCIATQNQTPLIHNTIWTTEWLARSNGMEVGFPAAIDRIAVTWMRDLVAAGWFDDHPVVGIVGDKCAATKPFIDGPLKAAVEQAGASKVVIAEHDCDPQSIASQPPSFVTQFRSAGVTKVILGSNFVSTTVFLKAAQAQLWHPKYTVSDWWQLSQNTSAKNYDPDQFDGAIAVTSNGLLLPTSGEPPYPGADRCAQVATDAGMPPLEFTTRNAELWAFCDNFFLMVDGIAAAGPNPTRPLWAQAIQGLPTRQSVVFGPSTFGPGKTTGSDEVFTAIWHRDCTCFKKASDFRPAAA